MNRLISLVMPLVVLAACNVYKPVSNKAADVLTEPQLSDVRIGGAVGAKMENFFEKRIFSDYARQVVMQEAEDAFKNKIDDIAKAPIGYWQGEFWGKLMISASRVAMYENDPEFTKYVLEEAHRLLQYQEADGYLGTYSDKEYVTGPDIAEARKVMGWDCDWCWNLWCRKYTMWGLLMAYEATGDKTLVDAVVKSMDQEMEMLEKLGLKQWETGTPHFYGLPSCSILKPLMQLYRYTGYSRYLDLGRELVAHWDEENGDIPNLIANAFSGKPVSEWYPAPERWAKAYEMMSCLDGLLEYYRVTGETRPLEAVKAIQKLLWKYERNQLQSVGYNDQFTAGGTHLNGISEPCDAIHWMRLNHDLFLITGDPQYVDVIEYTFYNAFLAGVFRDGTWGARGVRAEGRHLVAHGQALLEHSHCCVNNMPRAFMDVAQTVVSADAGGAVYVNWYSDSRASIAGVNVEISGNYPVGDKVQVKVSSERPATLRFRIPSWSASTSVNGKPAQSGWFEAAVEGEEVFELSFDMTPYILDSGRPATGAIPEDDFRYRRWKSGDEEIAPLFRTQPMAQIFRGPMVLAKSKLVGDEEKDIFVRESVLGKDFSVSLEPIVCDNVWGAWDLKLSTKGKIISTKVCDYSSAGDFESTDDSRVFSVYF